MVNPNEIDRRKPVWIALSDLWLDTEIDEEWAKQIASVIAESELGEGEVDGIFKYELAPFLGPNHWSVAGELTGFDPEWVCVEAEKRFRHRKLMDKITSGIGLTTYAAKDAFARVKELAFSET